MNAPVATVTLDLFSVPAGQLLTAFGAGNATPGPGSAAALNGALACELVLTGTKLTATRVSDDPRLRIVEKIRSQLEPKAQLLRTLAQRDTDVFQEARDARAAKKKTSDPVLKRRYANQARRRLATANDILVEIAKECVVVGKLALQMLQYVWGGAKGEPIAGVNNAIAGAMTAVGVALFNLQQCKGKRAQAVRAAVNQAFLEMTAIQHNMFTVLIGMDRDLDGLGPEQQLAFDLR